MKNLLMISCLVLFISCKKREEPLHSFYFETPQPVNDAELSHFPNAFRGTYIAADSSILQIDNEKMIRQHYFKFRIHKLEKDTLNKYFAFTDGRYFDKRTKDWYDYKNVGDSIELKNEAADTLFIFSETQKAKRIGGDLVLNYRDSVYWKADWLSLRKDTLDLHYFSSDQDITSINAVTKTKAVLVDSLFYVIRPTRKEFKKIIRLDHIGDVQSFAKAGKKKVR